MVCDAESEYEAFLSFAKSNPDNCVFLVDTFDTLRSGIPNAIKVANDYLKPNGLKFKGIRIDSGDLDYLSKQARKMFIEVGFPQAKICLSNGLNADTIENLIIQGAEFDILGVGDNISKPEGRMGCVYKEVALNKDGYLEPKIKLSNDAIKIVNPDFKKLYRAYDNETGYAIADIMTRQNETITSENLIIVSPQDYLKRKEITNFNIKELQVPIFLDGTLVYEDPELDEKKRYCEEQMATIYPEVKRNKMPHQYHVSGTEEYVEFKNEMIENARKLTLHR
jgi:nicotinate phosphoribosyltransferase